MYAAPTRTSAASAASAAAGASTSTSDADTVPAKEDWLDRLVREHEAAEAEQYRQADAAQQAQRNVAPSLVETQTHAPGSSGIHQQQGWGLADHVPSALADFSGGVPNRMPVGSSTGADKRANEDDISSIFSSAQVSTREPAYDFSADPFLNAGIPNANVADAQGSSITASQFMSYMFDPLDFTDIFDVQVNPGSVDLSPESQDELAPTSLQPADLAGNVAQYEPQFPPHDHFPGSSGVDPMATQFQTGNGAVEGSFGAIGLQAGPSNVQQAGSSFPQAWPANYLANGVSLAQLDNTSYGGGPGSGLFDGSVTASTSKWKGVSRAHSSPDTATKLSEDRTHSPETANTTPGSSSMAGPSDPSPKLTSNTKRKVVELESPSKISGAKTVTPEVFAQRQYERQAEARKVAKSIIDISVVCEGCSRRIANALFHYSDSYEQVTGDYRFQVQCASCNEKGRGKQQQTIKREGGGETDLKTHYQDCDLCEKTLGSITIFSEADRPPSVELVCAKCESQFAWCTQCGGGSKYRTGKWRPKKLFLPGRKTCKLRSIRLAGTPIVEIYDLGDPDYPLPEEIVDGMRETFESKFLFRFAKPQFITDTMPMERLEQIMRDWWDDIEARLREPESAMNGVIRIVSVLRGQITAAGKGKTTEEAVLSYQVLEWSPLQNYVLMASARISLTGLASMRWMVVAGKAGCYWMFVKAQRRLRGENAPPLTLETVRHPDFPKYLLRFDTDMDMERVRTLVTKGWTEIARTPISETMTTPRNAWQLRSEQAFTQLEGEQSRGKKLVELRWYFDFLDPMPDETAVLERISPCKTIGRPFKPDEVKEREIFSNSQKKLFPIVVGSLP